MDSPEAKELRLVGNVELRLAMIMTDGAMEKALNTYLAPLLLKLASEFVSVRNKVISVCQHVNTRIKPPYVAPIPGHERFDFVTCHLARSLFQTP